MCVERERGGGLIERECWITFEGVCVCAEVCVRERERERERCKRSLLMPNKMIESMRML